jgi:DNA-binding MarR family transcriptional regulator
MKQSEQKLTLDLENHFTALVLWLSNKMTAGASKAYRRKFEMGVNEWRVLSYVELFPWSTGKQMCDLMGVDKSAVSRGCAVLMERGLIVSRPRGLRKIEYGITPKGKTAFQQFLRVSVARQEALLTGFSSAERKLLISFMHRLLENLPLADEASAD